MKINHILVTLLAFFIFAANVTLAQDESQCFIDEHNVAINGYDAVSYFTVNKAVKGNEKHKVTFDNASFYFASRKNKELFEKNPMKYMPQYGGYCAFGMGAKNANVPTNKTHQRWMFERMKDVFDYKYKELNGKLSKELYLMRLLNRQS